MADFPEAAAEPGRTCPLHYRYAPEAVGASEPTVAGTLYVVGGLYGNRPALDALDSVLESDGGEPAVCFNGDFHWFDADPADFAAVDDAVATRLAIRGNVETELADDDGDSGCGCAYPEWVDGDTVSRSNAVMARLHATAATFPHRRRRLAALPMHRRFDVGSLRVAVVHGDVESLSGWGFAAERMDDPDHHAWLEKAFARTGTSVLASTHTCLPVARSLVVDGRSRFLLNNGAAGMPNLAGTRFGIVTRISVRPPEEVEILYGVEHQGVHLHAVPLRYDHEAWMRTFLATWPPGSPAHDSYHARLVDGPAHTLGRARFR